MNRIFAPLVLVYASFFLAPQPATAVITIDTVPIGDVGNANDPVTGNLYGSVSYGYRIGTTEVTNAQYAAFLNEKAKSDPLRLYTTFMGSNVRGGITRSGSSPNFSYSVKPNMGNKPVNFVSWYDAIRFINWLNNGQGTSDTETGAYTILDFDDTPSNGSSITRNTGAKWFMPTENEWYKAAYYHPTAQGGDADNYWLYATKSNAEPTIATASFVGDISNPGANVVNYSNGAVWNGITGNATTVGSAGPLSRSFYGTSDQTGNFIEWNETLIGSSRSIRGGAFDYAADELFYMQSLYRITNSIPETENLGLGFRVATVPEPGSGVLAIVACGLMWWSTKRFSKRLCRRH